jgi:lipopolysaccharide/colanic/teichoic acid biosynthesis glycosyltransferase
MLKRVFDFLLALFGLILASPIFLLVSVLIKLNDGSHVFYCQDRVGKDAKIFKGLQFRTMILDAEKSSGAIQSPENDPRVTKTGKILRASAVDELPQLINILNGDMSFVGPRALRPLEIEVGSGIERSVFDYPDFMKRCKVRPGLTGISQILLPRDAPREVKFKYDLWYIENSSFWLDIYLIILSFIISFCGEWEVRKEKIPFLAGALRARVEDGFSSDEI